MSTIAHHSINLADQTFSLEVHFKKGLKNINFKVPEPQKIKFSCQPRTSLSEIERIIRRHQDWLLKQNQKIQLKTSRQKILYREGELHLYLGKSFPLKINYHPLKRSRLEFSENFFIANLCYDLSSRQQTRMLETLFEKFYLQSTKQSVLAALPDLQKIDHRQVKSVSVKNIKTRWGSCSAKGNLNFSHRLAQLPPEIQYYIIVHEYCHLFQMNHSARFWTKVAEFLPDYSQLRARLRKIEKQ